MVRCVTVTPICRSFISLHKAVPSIRSMARAESRIASRPASEVKVPVAMISPLSA